MQTRDTNVPSTHPPKVGITPTSALDNLQGTISPGPLDCRKHTHVLQGGEFIGQNFLKENLSENHLSSCFSRCQEKPWKYGALRSGSMWSRQWWSLLAGRWTLCDGMWEVGRKQQEKQKEICVFQTFYLKKIYRIVRR